MRFQTNSVKTERDFIVRTRNFLGGGGEGAYLGSICQGIWARSPPPHNSPPPENYQRRILENCIDGGVNIWDNCLDFWEIA